MARTRPFVALAVVLLALAPACGRRAPVPLVAPQPAPDDGSIPPPREVPPAAEPSDAKDAMEVMLVYTAKGEWKAQYPPGQRVVIGGGRARKTANERDAVGALVLPLGRPVKFTVTAEAGASQFEIAAFPLVIAPASEGPRSVTVKPKRTGEFVVWSGPDRIGRAIVVPITEFDAWLAGIAPLGAAGPVDGSPSQLGRQLFLRNQCASCHNGKPDAKGPTLEGLYGSKVALKGGGAELADEQYFIESVRRPKAKVVEGWEPIMPEFGEDKVSTEEMVALVAYLRSLKAGDQKKEERFPLPSGAPKEPPAPPK